MPWRSGSPCRWSGAAVLSAGATSTSRLARNDLRVAGAIRPLPRDLVHPRLIGRNEDDPPARPPRPAAPAPTRPRRTAPGADGPWPPRRRRRRSAIPAGSRRPAPADLLPCASAGAPSKVRQKARNKRRATKDRTAPISLDRHSRGHGEPGREALLLDPGLPRSRK